MAAWAVVGCINGVWWSRAGPCPGLQTIGRAELAAIVQIINGADPGTILTDCLGISGGVSALWTAASPEKNWADA